MGLVETVGPFLAIVLASDLWMYLVSGKELRRSQERREDHFKRRKSEGAWVNSYLKLAQSRGLPLWPAYVNRAARIAMWVALLCWFAYRFMPQLHR